MWAPHKLQVFVGTYPGAIFVYFCGLCRGWCLELGVSKLVFPITSSSTILTLTISGSLSFFPCFPFLVLNHINQYKPHFFSVDAYDIMWPLKLRHAEEPDIQKISHEEKRLHLWRCQCPPMCRLPMVGMASGSLGLGHSVWFVLNCSELDMSRIGVCCLRYSLKSSLLQPFVFFFVGFDKARPQNIYFMLKADIRSSKTLTTSQ